MLERGRGTGLQLLLPLPVLGLSEMQLPGACNLQLLGIVAKLVSCSLDLGPPDTEKLLARLAQALIALR